MCQVSFLQLSIVLGFWICAARKVCRREAGGLRVLHFHESLFCKACQQPKKNSRPSGSMLLATMPKSAKQAWGSTSAQAYTISNAIHFYSLCAEYTPNPPYSKLDCNCQVDRYLHSGRMAPSRLRNLDVAGQILISCFITSCMEPCNFAGFHLFIPFSRMPAFSQCCQRLQTWTASSCSAMQPSIPCREPCVRRRTHCKRRLLPWNGGLLARGGGE